ncbi:NADP-dependent oxidoreductase [Corynebacterium variabile]|uniref:Oxidoreductase n=1 Tax=Corynebacterium variabile TaxID=1727 RepID=A0A4Y4C3A3_9CORY|nr:NADP-dependent oxidoreductase [Corynebacterium variabile]GEC87511.1 oxidoreductase [Corynebacterium variabile]
MRNVIYRRFGGPQVLELVDSPTPRPGPGQILIYVYATAVNAFDWRVREGQKLGAHPVTLPAGLGIDAAGMVAAVGEGVGNVRIGDAVFGEGVNTYAESAVLTVWAPKPPELTFDEAAGYPSVVETALRVLDEVAVHPGERLLISGAAGGVGSAVVQIARARGIHVVGTAGFDNQEYLRGLGAETTTYGPGWVGRVREFGPVDAALDLAGAGVLPELVELTGNADRVVSIADTGAAAHGVRFSGAAGDVHAALVESSRLIAEGKLRLPVAKTYSLSEAADAHADSRRGHTRGRRIITVRRGD